MYTLRIFYPYEPDVVHEFDSIEEAIDHIRKHSLYLDDCQLYRTPDLLNLYSLMCPRTQRSGGKAYP